MALRAATRTVMAGVGVAGALSSSEISVEAEPAQPDQVHTIFAPAPSKSMCSSEESLDSFVHVRDKSMSPAPRRDQQLAASSRNNRLVMQLGAELAQDPSVQRAVFRKIGFSPGMGKQFMGEEAKRLRLEFDKCEGLSSSQSSCGSSTFVNKDDVIDTARLAQEVRALRDEIESQRELNEQLIYHADALALQKKELQNKFDQQRRELVSENRKLRNRLARKGGSSTEEGKHRASEEDVNALLRDELCNHVPIDVSNEGDPLDDMEDPPLKEEEGDSTYDQVVEAALGVAAIMIVGVLLRRVGACTAASTALKGAFAWVGSQITSK